MRNARSSRPAAWPAVLVGVLFLVSAAGAASAIEIQLKDGRILRGKLGQTASVAEGPRLASPDGRGPIQNIKFLDDELRRTYFSDRIIDPRNGVHQEESRQVLEKFNIRQRALHVEPGHGGPRVASVGPAMRIQPFDQYGRRTYTMFTVRGQVDIVQGITVLTPEWAKVEGITHCWDMRIATSSIPQSALHSILIKQTDPTKLEHQKKIARFYIQCERYKEAVKVLNGLIKSFPGLDAQEKQQLEASLRTIKQLSAEQMIRELKTRHNAGQHRFVWTMLQQFPAEDIGGDVLQPAREMIQDYQARQSRRDAAIKQLKALADRLKDTIAKENLKPILDEIAKEVDQDTLDRLAAFLQTADDAQTPDAEKLALAVSGWLLGADAATPKLPMAISAYKLRGLVREYLNGGSTPEREQAFSYIKEQAGGLETVAQLLAHMKPAVAAGEPSADKPGYYELHVPASGGEGVTYYVQLPPEYNPYRLYPTIVALHGEGEPTDEMAQKQINWWAGDWGRGGLRTGQASRLGYIVIAPAWTAQHQKHYGYSAREHAAVLGSLRDACRRFAIDTDRVYLTGYSMGGDAAWDLGLAHPDLWAGVIPVSAQSGRYCNLYWENAKYVPFYVILGELDGGRLANDAMDLDRYLRRGFDTTLVEYRGRGHDDFYEEVLRMFDWMSRMRRNFFPRKFACQTMRSWDNFFWWLEVHGLPPRSDVDPSDWPPPKGSQPVQIKGDINDKNGMNIRTGTTRVTVWLSPKMLDFKKRSVITVNGRRINPPDQTIRPDLHVLLEDVRTRGDRLHPFWAKLESATGRVKSDQ
ncbi:MAG: PHB depolymerase family esterase [Thermoguttaceae bacterium]